MAIGNLAPFGAGVFKRGFAVGVGRQLVVLSGFGLALRDRRWGGRLSAGMMGEILTVFSV